ncbi:cupin domain-containing protein [Candidatus Latescibacterota bacterium]
MLKKMISASLILLCAVSTVSLAQTLDGNPYTPGKDANIDMFMGSWKDSMPRHSHGSLIERDILTKGDNMNPTTKGAVLKYTNRYVYATLDAKASTIPTTLKGEQEIFYFLSGKGTIKAGRTTEEISAGYAVLMPENLEFTINNTGSEQLTMYLISEAVPAGFKPNKEMKVINENTMPISGTTGHWAHIVKRLFEKPDGLATLYSVLTVAHDPMTIGHPHSHDPGCEEIWTGIKGTSIAFLGKQIRMQPPGTAYNIPPDGKTPHCNINKGDEQIKLFYFSVRKDIDGTGI